MDYFSWDGGCALPQNSYQPSNELREATFKKKNHIGLTELTHLNKTHRQTSCYFYIKISKKNSGPLLNPSPQSYVYLEASRGVSSHQ